jgi:hypothetical protein
LIFEDHFYFKPKFFRFDANYRIIYTLDKKAVLQLNFLTNRVVDIRYLYLILSAMQLNLLGITSRDITTDYITLVGKYLSLELDIKTKRKIAIFRRFLYGIEVESWLITLTDSEFNLAFLSQLIKLQIIKDRDNKVKSLDSS